MKLDAILPWEPQPATDADYHKLNLVLVVDDKFGTLAVKVDRSSQLFRVVLNALPISGRAYEQRADAIAEAERYFYAMPQFAASSRAKLLNAAIEVGRAAYENGVSVYANPHPRNTVGSSQWLMGWLTEFYNQNSQTVLEAATATAKANAVLEHDISTATNRLRALKLAWEYAQIVAAEDGARAAVFMRDFDRADGTLWRNKWPDFIAYLAANGAMVDAPPTEEQADASATDK